MVFNRVGFLCKKKRRSAHRTTYVPWKELLSSHVQNYRGQSEEDKYFKEPIRAQNKNKKTVQSARKRGWLRRDCFFALNLIGWKSGASFLDQSHIVIKQNESNPEWVLSTSYLNNESKELENSRLFKRTVHLNAGILFIYHFGVNFIKKLYAFETPWLPQIGQLSSHSPASTSPSSWLPQVRK